MTQIHTAGDAQLWCWWDRGAITHGGSDDPRVVTTDGKVHRL